MQLLQNHAIGEISFKGVKEPIENSMLNYSREQEN